MACPPAGPGPGGAERYITSDDGTAVLWIPEGATTADNITVTRKASDDKLVYELLPDGLKLAKPAVLFARAGGVSRARANPDDPPGVTMLEGAVVSSDGTSEVTTTVRAALSGNEGRQHGMSAMVIPHFTSATFGAYGVTGIFASLTDEDRPTFRRNVGEAWSAKFFIKAPMIPDGEFTAQATGSLELQSAGALPVSFPTTTSQLTFGLPVRCKEGGPGFIRVQLKMRDKPSLITFALGGLCSAPAFAAALEDTRDQLGVPDEQALIELVEQLMGALPEPKPTTPAEPLENLPPPRPVTDFTMTLTLQCTTCQKGMTYTGLFRVTNNSSVPLSSSDLHALTITATRPLEVLPPRDKYDVVARAGESVEHEFRYQCGAVGTATLLPAFEQYRDTGQELVIDQVTDIYKTPDGKEVTIACIGGDPAMRVGMSDVFPVNGENAGSWALGAASVFVDVQNPTAQQYPVDEDTSLWAEEKDGISAAGPSPLTLSSGAQNVTATHDPVTGEYLVAGTSPGGAFLASDTLHITGLDANPESIAAPAAPTNANLFLSTSNAWNTVVRYPEGHGNLLTVTVEFEPPPIGMGPGTFKLKRVVPSAELRLVNGFRETPLLPPATAAQIVATGLVVKSVDVMTANRKTATTNFVLMPPREIHVYAGRTFHIEGRELFGGGTGGGTGGGGGTATGGGGGTATGGGGGTATGGGGGGGTATGGGGGTATGGGGGTATGGGGGTATGGGGGTSAGGGGGTPTGGGMGGGGGSTTFITLTPDNGAVSAELAQRLGENHAGSIQQRFVGTASVESGNVLIFDNPMGSTVKLIGVLATFAAGTAEGGFSNSAQPTTRFIAGTNVKAGERWAMVTSVGPGQRVTLERWAFVGSGPLVATSLELVVLGEYEPQFTVAAGAWLKLGENRGPDIWNFGVLFMTMSPGGQDPAMLARSCPGGFNCATPGRIGRNTLPASAGLGLPVDDVYEVSAIDRMGDVPISATFTIYLSVPGTGPHRIIWNRL